VAVLVFPRITKVGLVFGGQHGEGVLFRNGKADGYYVNMGASWGLQAGAKQYGYAMFFMTEGALSALTATNGFEIGIGPTVVVVDQRMAKQMPTMNLDSDIYAFIFTTRGLMAGLGLRGNRISRASR
jgi:lipid-binding SYLF domain-containing protein